MAKQIGIKIKGRIEEYSFYHNYLHGYLVRHMGGVTSKQYHSDDRYAAARSASQEFASVSKAGKLIRTALAEFITPVKDGTMVNRLNKELVALKQLDNKHDRGNRKSETKIADSNANKWLRIFQFNDNAKLYNLCGDARLLSRAIRDRVHSNNYQVKLQSASFPITASHAGLTWIQTVIDFENETFKTTASSMRIVSNKNWDELLQLEQTACCRELMARDTTAGIEITCLQVLFFREENGKLLQLKEKVHSMGVLDIKQIVVPQSPATRRKQPNKRRKNVSWRESMTRTRKNRIIVAKVLVTKDVPILRFSFPNFNPLILSLAKQNIKQLKLPSLNLFPLRNLLSWEFSATQSLGVDAFGTSERNVFAGIPE